MIGSPPQVRGKQSVYKSVCAVPRITPAGAGKTSSSYRTTIHLQDHPRRCGENLLIFATASSRAGSPPQVRGKLSFTVEPRKQYRITPAGAGKTLIVMLSRPLVWDHPRRCGENQTKPVTIRMSIGSPPQVRGKLYNCRCAMGTRRITPAGAGKTRCDAARSAVPEDHPRRCGENVLPRLYAVPVPGSPPQVRGKHGNVTSASLKGRITPAGAGKTNSMLFRFRNT